MDNDRGSGDREKGKLFRRTKLRAAAEQLSTIYESVLESSQIDIEYVALLSLAGLIALFGLLENSAAVIIGAMLISPLMNPILSAALALLLGDGKLGKRSASVLAFSVAGDHRHHLAGRFSHAAKASDARDLRPYSTESPRSLHCFPFRARRHFGASRWFR